MHTEKTTPAPPAPLMNNFGLVLVHTAGRRR